MDSIRILVFVFLLTVFLPAESATPRTLQVKKSIQKKMETLSVFRKSNTDFNASKIILKTGSVKARKKIESTDPFSIIDEADTVVNHVNNRKQTKNGIKNLDPRPPVPQIQNAEGKQSIILPENANSVGVAIDVLAGRKIENNKCEVQLTNESVNTFRHIVYYSESTYVYLKLDVANGSDINITSSGKVIGKNIWIWTFYGKEGSMEFLKWPEEFGIWSMGLLYNYVIRGPFTVTLERVSGDCSSLEVGTPGNDKIISKALKRLTVEMMQLTMKYGPSFFCYKQRMFIADHNVYILCKHIVCPIEAIKHQCCAFVYNKTLGERDVACLKKSFEYDVLWWVIPSIISMVLFVYSPILMTFLAYICTISDKGTVELKPEQLRNPNEVSIDSLGKRLLAGSTGDVILLTGYLHVTLVKTLLYPLILLRNKCLTESTSCFVTMLCRSTRMLLPIFSLSFIALQVILDYYFLYEFVLESMKTGVPMGFRSILGGYAESKLNFLPYLGGPFMAIGLYLIVTSLLLTIPESPIKLVTNTLRPTVDEISPLSLGTRTIGSLGSVRIFKRNEYGQLYHLLLARFYMLLNIKFWKHCLAIQVQRWESCVSNHRSILLLPIYVLLCIIELILTAIFNSLPIMSFGYSIVAGYTRRLTFRQSRGFCSTICYIGFFIFLFLGVLYSLLMFCTIFLDATLFVTRVFIFTFTGIIVYPKTAYGYLIFCFTVFYYLWDSVGDYALLYDQLLRDTVQAASMVERANDVEKLVHKVNGESGVRASLFEFVIEVHKPRRKQVFLSFLKAAIVLTSLWMLINLLLNTDNFRELHVIMHVGTALFICALPQITKTVCRSKRNRLNQKRFRAELADTIRIYMGYCTENESSYCDSE